MTAGDLIVRNATWLDVEAGDYRVFVGGGQPGTGAPGETAAFAIVGRAPLPRSAAVIWNRKSLRNRCC